MEHHLSTRLQEFRVIICQRCEYAIHSIEVYSHLKGHYHRLSHQTAGQVSQAVQQWEVARNPDLEVNVPKTAQRPIPGLKQPLPGWLCNCEPARCQYICQNIKSLKEH